MSSIKEALIKFENDPYRGSTEDYRLISAVAQPCGPEDMSRAWPGVVLPEDVVAFWSVCRTAQLYVDIAYGQWGLELLDPWRSAERTREERMARPAEFLANDLVIGAFIGDLELLVVAPSEPPERRILAAEPLDPRVDWPAAATNLASFLEKYFEAAGEKYWDPSARN